MKSVRKKHFLTDTRFLFIVFLLTVTLCMCPFTTSQGRAERLRLIVMTDIGEGDPDDEMSMVRLLMYSNEWDIEGLIATKNKPGHSIHPDSICKYIEAYDKVRPNLLKHASDWPAKDYLLSRTKVGQDGVNMRIVGDGKDTEGSNLIISVVDKPDPRPVWLISWDGLSTPAQALWDVRRQRSKEAIDKFVAKIRLYTITEDYDVGPWIRKTFPNLHYIWTDRGKTWTGISDGGDQSCINAAWRSENIVENHGPLGAVYPRKAPWLVEGDTPSFLFLMSFNGLCDPMHPDYGGWGGRYKRVNTWWYDTDRGDEGLGENRPRNTIWRWRPAYQNDFAARMDWCVKPYNQANHPPQVNLGHESKLKVGKGQKIRLSAEGTSDPDGDKIIYKWRHYEEAGTYKGKVNVRNANKRQAFFAVPSDGKKGQTIHIICEVTDNGIPSLTRYRRVIVEIEK